MTTEDTHSASREDARHVWDRYLKADFGFRNYWYPVLESRKLKRRPQSVTVLGEKIALIRHGKHVYGLNDRCPHRGVPLSAGRQILPGTVSCAYHGWTYDLKSGDLAAALTDGPESPICEKRSVKVRTYPAREHLGLIWLYIGEGEPPAFEDDLPEALVAAHTTAEPTIELRKGDWRYAMENAVDEAHAKYLHRYTPFYFFTKFPAFTKNVRMVEDETGKWLMREGTPVFGTQEYPRAGRWPPRERWKVTTSAPAELGARMPSTFVIGHETWKDYQIFVPVDREHHLAVFISASWVRGWKRFLWKARFWFYIRPLHHVMLNRWEDDRIVKLMSIPPEKLFRPDIAITAWRRWASANARDAPLVARQPGSPSSEAIGR